MANPATYQKAAADNGAVTVTCTVTAGAAGAIATVQRSRELALEPVTHESTGNYTLHLKEVWVHLLGAYGLVIQATFSAAGAYEVAIQAPTSVKDIPFKVCTSAGVPIDLITGDVLKLVCELQKTDPSK